MTNMSYCRFQNTATDLDDCAEALDALIQARHGDADSEPETLSRREIEAAKQLIHTALNIAFMAAEAAGVEVGDLDDSNAIENLVDQLADAAQRAAERRSADV